MLPKDDPRSEREQEFENAVEAAREYLYRGGMHYHGDLHAFLGNPNTGLGGMIDLAEVLALYALALKGDRNVEQSGTE